MWKSIFISIVLASSVVSAQSICEKQKVCPRIAAICDESMLSFVCRGQPTSCIKERKQQLHCSSCDADVKSCQDKENATRKYEQDCKNDVIKDYVWTNGKCISKEEQRQLQMSACKDAFKAVVQINVEETCPVGTPECSEDAVLETLVTICGKDITTYENTFKTLIDEYKAAIDERKQSMKDDQEAIRTERANPAGVVNLNTLHELGEDIQLCQREIKLFTARLTYVQKQLKNSKKK